MSRQRRKGGSRLQKRTAGEWLRLRGTKVKLVLWSVLLVILVAAVLAVRIYIRPPEIAGSSGDGIISSLIASLTGGDQSGDELSGTVENGDASAETITAEMATPKSVEGRKDGVYTLLVFGEDTTSGNTDTIMLVSMDTVNKTVNVVSIPRDTMLNVTTKVKKVNMIYQISGLEGLETQISKITGITPDAYVKIQWEAVGTLVDAIGGVYFDVPYDMDYDDPAQDLSIHLSSGYQLLDGEKAMELVRWRKNNDGSLSVGDVGRLNIQHDFLKEVAAQTLSLENVANLDKLVKVFNENVETDLTVGNLLWFASQFSSMDLDQDLAFYTLPGNVEGRYNGLSYVILYPDEILELMNESFSPYTAEITEADLDIMYEDSDGDFVVTSGGR